MQRTNNSFQAHLAGLKERGFKESYSSDSVSHQYTCENSESGLNEHKLRNILYDQWHFRRQTSSRTMLDTKKNATFWLQKYCCLQWLLMIILFVQWIVNMLWQNKRPSSPVITTNVFLSNATKSHAWETWSHFHVIFCTAKNIQLSQNEFSFLPDLFWFLSFGQNNDHGESILLLIEWRLMVVAIISQVFLHIFFPAKMKRGRTNNSC